MKQTAVEWLADILELNNTSKQYHKEIQQAKEMEKQQIIDAYYGEAKSTKILDAEEYYNKTFKKK